MRNKRAFGVKIQDKYLINNVVIKSSDYDKYPVIKSVLKLADPDPMESSLLKQQMNSDLVRRGAWEMRIQSHLATHFSLGNTPICIKNLTNITNFVEKAYTEDCLKRRPSDKVLANTRMTDLMFTNHLKERLAAAKAGIKKQWSEENTIFSQMYSLVLNFFVLIKDMIISACKVVKKLFSQSKAAEVLDERGEIDPTESRISSGEF